MNLAIRILIILLLGFILYLFGLEYSQFLLFVGILIYVEIRTPKKSRSHLN